MKTIKLTRGYEALVDDVYFDWLSHFTWRASIQSKGNLVYAQSEFKKADGSSMEIFMHSLVLFWAFEIDHINQNGLDNRRENLRPCTHAQNLSNRGMTKRNSSGFKGVRWNEEKKKWNAYIVKDSIRHHLGYFDDFEAAKVARLAAAKKYFGEFAGPHERTLKA